MTFSIMKLVVIFVLLPGVLQVLCAEFEFVCRRNCDNSSLLDPSSDIEIFLDCVKDCKSGLKFEWELKCQKCQQILQKEDIIGNGSPAIKINGTVLYPYQKYNLSVTADGKPFLRELSMGKCSRKYPCDESKFLDDYDYLDLDTEFISSPHETNVTVLWNTISEMTGHLNNMNNQTMAIRQKQLDILNLIELAIGLNAAEYPKAKDEISKVFKSTVYHALIGRRVAEVFVKAMHLYFKIVANDTTKLKETTEFHWDILYYLHGQYYTRLKNIVDDRKQKPKYLVQNLNGDIDTWNYTYFYDFDLVFRRRKETIEHLRELTFEIAKLFILRFGLMHETIGDEFREKGNEPLACCVKVRYFSKEVPADSTRPKQTDYYFSPELQTELKQYPNLSVALIEIWDIRAWGIEYYWNKMSCVGVGNFGDEYSEKLLNNPIKIGVKYISPPVWYNDVKGYFRMPINTAYDQITESYLGIHHLIVDEPIPVLMLVFRADHVADEIKIVVSRDRPLQMSDFYGNAVITLNQKRKTSGNNFFGAMYLNAAIGANCFIAILPSNATLIKNGIVKDGHIFYNYTIQIFRRRSFGTDNKFQKQFNTCSIVDDINVWEQVNHSCTRTGQIRMVNSAVKNVFVERYLNFDTAELTLEHAPYNFIMLVPLGVIGLLYCLIICVCNRQNVIKKEIIYLIDNNALHANEYFVSVQTGRFHRLAGTTANIAFQLHGTRASSQRHLLRGQREPLLQNSSEDWFYLLTENDLGNLQTIDLWTDCYGFKSSWFCEKIKIVNPNTKQTWIFKVDTWFSATDDNVHQRFDLNKSKIIKRQSRCTYAVYNLVDHLWIKSFSKLHAPIFSFLERLTVILLIFTLNMLMALVFLAIPIFDFNACVFRDTEYNYGVAELVASFGSALVTFSVAAILIYLFSNSGHFSHDKYSVYNISKFKLNYVCRAFAWVVLVLGLAASVSIVAIVGLNISFRTSQIWLHTFLVAVLLCIIFEGIRVMIIAASTRKLDSEQYAVDFSPINRLKEETKYCFGIEGMRHLFSKFYLPITQEEIEEKCLLENERKRFRYLRNDFIIYIIYIVILLALVILSNNSKAHLSYKNIKDVFVDDKHIQKIRLSEINSNKRFFRYMHKLFLPAIHRTDLCRYNSSTNPGCQIDFNSKMFGVARIRQTRVANKTCRIQSHMQRITKECHSDYNIFREDTRNYDPEWRPFKESSPKDVPQESWMHRRWLEAKAMPYIGELAVYPGGGYVVNFGRTYENSLLVLQYIAILNWIDERTRAVFLDVNFYNTNENIFHYFTIAIEHSATGAFITSIKLYNVRFLSEQDTHAIIITSLKFLLAACIILFARNKFLEYKELHSSNTWNKIDLVIIFLVISYLLLSCGRNAVTESTLQAIKNSTQQEHFPLLEIIIHEEITKIISAALTVLSVVRMCKFFSLAQQCRLFKITLMLASKHLVSTGFTSVILIFVYGVLGFLLFGAYIQEFRTVWTSFITLLLIVSRVKVIGSLDSHQTIYSIYFFGFFALVVILFSILLGIIVTSYHNAKLYYIEDLRKIKYNVFDFLRDEAKYRRCKNRGRLTNAAIINESNLAERRLRAGQDSRNTCVDGLRLRTIALFEKVAVNSQSIIDLHQITEEVLTLMRDPHLSYCEKNYLATRILSYFLRNYLKTKPDGDNTKDEYFVMRDDKDTIYCSTKRQQEIKLIVEHFLKNKEMTSLLEGNRVLVEKQLNELREISGLADKLIAAAVDLLSSEIAEKSTGVTFAELNLEAVSVYSVDSEDIERERKTVYF